MGMDWICIVRMGANWFVSKTDELNADREETYGSS